MLNLFTAPHVDKLCLQLLPRCFSKLSIDVSFCISSVSAGSFLTRTQYILLTVHLLPVKLENVGICLNKTLFDIISHSRFLPGTEYFNSTSAWLIGVDGSPWLCAGKNPETLEPGNPENYLTPIA